MFRTTFWESPLRNSPGQKISYYLRNGYMDMYIFQYREPVLMKTGIFSSKSSSGILWRGSLDKGRVPLYQCQPWRYFQITAEDGLEGEFVIGYKEPCKVMWQRSGIKCWQSAIIGSIQWHQEGKAIVGVNALLKKWDILLTINSIQQISLCWLSKRLRVWYSQAGFCRCSWRL